VAERSVVKPIGGRFESFPWSQFLFPEGNGCSRLSAIVERTKSFTAWQLLPLGAPEINFVSKAVTVLDPARS
jgi:hypothetical protein